MRGNYRARVDQSHPEAFAICDRCGFVYNLPDLQYQFDFAGTGLVNKRILVCGSCLDKPNEGLRTIKLPADPVPVRDPRPSQWASMMGDAPPDIPVSQLVED